MIDGINTADCDIAVYQKDPNVSIGKHERSKIEGASNCPTTGRKGFSDDDIIVLCSDIARSENIFVKSYGKSRTGDDINNLSPSKEASSFSKMFQSVRGSFRKKKSRDSSEGENQNEAREPVPGLQGREIVAMAILVDKEGVPMKSYTEHEDIPSDEIESAGNVFVSRVPLPASKEKETKKDLEQTHSDRSSEPLTDYLSGRLDIDVKKKLIKRMERAVVRLHTTDLNTARSFLKTDRYSNVRKSIKTELINFIKSDLKMNPVNKSLP